TSICDIDEERRIAELAPEGGYLGREGLPHEVDEIDAAGEELAKPIGRERDARVDFDHGSGVEPVKLLSPACHQRQHGAATRAAHNAAETLRRCRPFGSGATGQRQRPARDSAEEPMGWCHPASS